MRYGRSQVSSPPPIRPGRISRKAFEVSPASRCCWRGEGFGRLLMQLIVLILAVLVLAPFVQQSFPGLRSLTEPPPTASEICARNPDWTDRDCRWIAAGAVWPGMTESMARASIGDPLAIHRCDGEWGSYEKWVYEAGYLHFENGILISLDDPTAL